MQASVRSAHDLWGAKRRLKTDEGRLSFRPENTLISLISLYTLLLTPVYSPARSSPAICCCCYISLTLWYKACSYSSASFPHKTLHSLHTTSPSTPWQSFSDLGVEAPLRKPAVPSALMPRRAAATADMQLGRPWWLLSISSNENQPLFRKQGSYYSHAGQPAHALTPASDSCM